MSIIISVDNITEYINDQIVTEIKQKVPVNNSIIVAWEVFLVCKIVAQATIWLFTLLRRYLNFGQLRACQLMHERII